MRSIHSVPSEGCGRTLLFSIVDVGLCKLGSVAASVGGMIILVPAYGDGTTACPDGSGVGAMILDLTLTDCAQTAPQNKPVKVKSAATNDCDLTLLFISVHAPRNLHSLCANPLAVFFVWL